MTLIILAHPKFDNSFASKTIIEELRNSELDLEIRDIHSLYPDYKIDVKVEQEALLRHQTIVFQYPLYWLNVPAILKQYIDEVFEYQFAYGTEGDKLKGKNFMLSFTAGGAEEAYQLSGKHHLRIYEFCKSLENTAYYAQMKYIDPICLYEVSLTAGYKEADIKRDAKEHAKTLIEILTGLTDRQDEKESLSLIV